MTDPSPTTGDFGWMPNVDDLFRFHNLLTEEALSILRKKSHDYSDSDNCFSNLDLIEHMTGGLVSTELGILTRLSDKLTRLAHLTRPNFNPQVSNESIEDTCIDIINYIVLLHFKRSCRASSASAVTPPSEDTP